MFRLGYYSIKSSPLENACLVWPDIISQNTHWVGQADSVLLPAKHRAFQKSPFTGVINTFKQKIIQEILFYYYILQPVDQHISDIF